MEELILLYVVIMWGKFMVVLKRIGEIDEGEWVRIVGG